MPTPIAVCLEDLHAGAGTTRYVRCVAVAGRQPGLALGGAGEILWREERAGTCEIWVSADDRLVLFRPEGAGPVTVRRGGRSLDVPFGKPVFLLDQDRVEAGGRDLRLHVHGRAPAVTAPEPLAPERRGKAWPSIAAMAFTAALGCPEPPIEVRGSPPEVEMDPDSDTTAAPPVDAADPGTDPATIPEVTTPPDGTAPPPPDGAIPSPPENPPIEVSPTPPSVAPPMDPPPELSVPAGTPKPAKGDQ